MRRIFPPGDSQLAKPHVDIKVNRKNFDQVSD